MSKILLTLGLMTLTTGCSFERTLRYPDTHVPVLLSRVDRIGKRSSASAKVLEVHSAINQLGAVSSSSTTRQGDYLVTTTTSSGFVVANNGGLVAAAAGRHDRDVRLSEVRTSTYTLIHLGGGMFGHTVESKGHVVEVHP